MIVYADYSRTETLRNLTSELKQGQKPQNSIVFLHTIDDQVENVVKTPFILASEPRKYTGDI